MTLWIVSLVNKDGEVSRQKFLVKMDWIPGKDSEEGWIEYLQQVKAKAQTCLDPDESWHRKYELSPDIVEFDQDGVCAL